MGSYNLSLSYHTFLTLKKKHNSNLKKREREREREAHLYEQWEGMTSYSGEI